MWLIPSVKSSSYVTNLNNNHSYSTVKASLSSHICLILMWTNTVFRYVIGNNAYCLCRSICIWSKGRGQKTQYSFKMSQLKNLLRFNMHNTHCLTDFFALYQFLINFTVLTFKHLIAKVYFPQCVNNSSVRANNNYRLCAVKQLVHT